MNDPSICPKCRNPLPLDSASGACPACLLALAFFPEPESLAERWIGGFRIEETLGRGGMGIVYRAHQETLGRTVALKMIVSGELASPEALRRFQVEAEAAAHLDHPNIVPIHEVGEIDGLPYYTMRLVEGGDLASAMAEFLPSDSRERQETAARFLIAVARAVDHAHRHGILHRDLKPTNILIDRQGEPQLVDFGLAKRLQAEEAAITLSSSAIGSPSYMAPEQSTGESTVASDVWSLGAILYEMLTGEPPFVGKSAMDTLRRVIDEEPVPPRKKNPLISRDLETICLKCLEKEPGRRYSSAAAFAEDLARFLAGEPVSARPVGKAAQFWRWCRRNPVPAILTTALLLALLVGFIGITSQWQRAKRANLDLAASVRHLEWRQLRSLEEGDQAGFVVAELARRLRSNPDDHNAANYALGLLTERRFPRPAGPTIFHPENKRLFDLCWDADGKRIAAHAADVQVWIYDGENAALLRTLELGGKIAALAMDAGGKSLAVATESEVRFFDPGSGEKIGESWSVEGISKLAFGADDSTLFGATPNRVECYDTGKRERVWNTAVPERPLKKLLVGGERLLLVFDTAVTLLDSRGGESLAEVNKKTRVRDATLSKNGSIFALITGEGAEVFNDTGSLIAGPLGPSGISRLFSLSLSETGDQLVAGDGLGGVHRWLLPEGRALGGSLEHRFAVDTIKLGKGGNVILTGSSDATARLWNCTTGKPVTEPMPHGDYIDSVAFLGGGRRVITGEGGFDGLWRYRIWTIPAPAARPNLRSVPEVSDSSPSRIIGMSAVALNSDASLAAICPEQWEFQVVTLSDGKTRKYPLSAAECYGLAFHPREPFLFVLASDGRLSRLNIETGDEVGTSANTGGGDGPSALSPDGNRFVAGHADGSYGVWDVSGTGQIRELWRRKFSQRASAVEFSPSGELVAVASNDGTAIVHKTDSGEVVARCIGHEKKILPIAFTPDGTRLVTGSYDFTARVWDVRTGQQVLPTLFHRNQVTGVTVSSDGRIIATGTRGGAVNLWDSATGDRLVEPMQESHAIRRVLFTKDNNRLISVSHGGVRQWDVATGEPISPLLRQRLVNGLGFYGSGELGYLPERDLLLFGANAADAILYDLSVPTEPAPAWFPEFLEAMVLQRIDEKGSPRAISFDEAVAVFDKLSRIEGEDRLLRQAREILGR